MWLSTFTLGIALVFGGVFLWLPRETISKTFKETVIEKLLRLDDFTSDHVLRLRIIGGLLLLSGLVFVGNSGITALTGCGLMGCQ